MSEAESSVRRYLQFLQDPSSARDEAAISAAQAAVDSAKDVIDRIKALAVLERASTADAEEIRSGFVLHAKAWATENGVTAAAFRQMQVPATALMEAGVLDGSPARKGKAKGSAAARSARVGIHAIQDAIPAGDFTLSDLMERAGGSPATVRKAVEALVGTGVVERVGSDPKHQGRGRAPILYRKA